jgi:hypothetical protein
MSMIICLAMPCAFHRRPTRSTIHLELLTNELRCRKDFRWSATEANLIHLHVHGRVQSQSTLASLQFCFQVLDLGFKPFVLLLQLLAGLVVLFP